MQRDDKSKIIARFPLASASTRFFSRLLDMLIVIGICIGIGFALICTDPFYSANDKNIIIGETWRYFLIAFFTLLFSFVYFIVIPYFWKGQTLMKKIFKLSFHNILPLKNFFIGLIKHELFIWILLVSINLIFSITLWALGAERATELIKDINVFSPNENNSGGIYAAAIIFSTAYLICGLIDVALVISLCVKNKKANVIDNFSSVVVIKLKDISSNEINTTLNQKKTRSKINYGLPGEINEDAIEEISKF